MKPAPAYDIRSLVHAYDGKTVLDIPQLEIPQGEICALSGPNGSGKTTLLAILALLLSPTPGACACVESKPFRAGAGSRLRRQVTLIHQKPILFTTTVWGNVSYGLWALGLPAKEIKARVGAVLEELGLSSLAESRRQAIRRGSATCGPGSGFGTGNAHSPSGRTHEFP